MINPDHCFCGFATANTSLLIDCRATGFTGWWSNSAKKVKSPRKVRPNGIRHTAITAATRAARAAHLGLEAVMAFSDHQNVKTLKFYLDEEDGLQR